ncbi:hypothetical protein A2Y99_03010 [Candidatus Gottesmanbacteria bacterium RBG_13_37_7]|uniref:DNA polymerase III subunit alpha n=1 Tax=Candidatus Gottesmanbacteria bacterium RBG_13_37_7 TaxID=1798369 RepID=A0A1F5YIE7_9BACT|nr:MAG: hypothetical protein A2Y99_03010 [Candidatus Gottesmanbacteria bacterium RBG_13_37_7]
MVALFRPGPMEWISLFIESKENPIKIKYPHPDLKHILAETYGIAVYQEQCMQIANQMAGYSMVEADKLRMAIGKKKRDLMKKEKEKFISGCIKKGYTKNVAEKIFSLIEKFVGYGFNKAHSASYAMIAYQTAYMKTKYPVEFMTAVLAAESRSSSGPARYEKVSQAILECKRMKIDLLPPDINSSDIEFSIEESDEKPLQKKIRFGLSAIKNVGEAAIEAILLTRKEKGLFRSFTDFIYRVDPSKVTKKTLESLIKAGAFDRFGKRAALLTVFPQIAEKAQMKRKNILAGQVSLFSISEDEELTDCIPDVEELSRQELLLFEKSLLGFYLTEHPLSPYIGMLEKKVTHKISELNSGIKTSIILGGLITQVKKIFTKTSNDEMAFVRVDDWTGGIEFVVFPSIYKRTKKIWLTDRVILAKGKLNQRNDRLSFLVDDAKLLDLNNE